MQPVSPDQRNQFTRQTQSPCVFCATPLSCRCQVWSPGGAETQGLFLLGILMNSLTIFSPSSPLSMTSREVAELVNSRHDSVKRTIERLADSKVIGLPPMVEYANKVGYLAKEYVFSGEKGKRDSLVVVAQISPEFTGRLVDRWQELEAAAANPLAKWNIPTNLADALQLAADQQRQIMAQQAELEAAQPKVEFHDEVSQSTGQFEIAEAARLILGGKIGNEKKLREWLLENGWVTRRSNGYRATAATESKGLLATRMGFQNGNSFSYAVVTPKGMVRLRHIFRVDDMLARFIINQPLFPTEVTQ